VVVLTTLGTLITRQLEKDLVPSDLAMLRIFVETASSDQADKRGRRWQTLRDYPGITRVEGQSVYEFAWKRPVSPRSRPGCSMRTPSRSASFAWNRWRLLKGRYPVEGQDEIAIEQRMARAQHLSDGRYADRAMNGNGERTLRIVGIVFQPYMYIGGGDGTTSALRDLYQRPADCRLQTALARSTLASPISRRRASSPTRSVSG